MKRIIIFLSGLLFLVSCGSKNNPGQVAETADEIHNEDGNEVMLSQPQFNTAGIQFGEVEMKQISGTFKANGLLDVPPQQMVSVSVNMGGFLKKTELLQGMRVKKGQLIATIENPDFVTIQQDYLDAKSQLEYAKADYERQQELAKENINAQKTLQQAKAAFQSLQAKTNALKERIKVVGLNLAAVEQGNIQSTVNLYAPISGFVTQVNANIGKYINPTDVLFEIVDTEHLHAELTIFEKDVPRLQIGQRVRFILANETTERIANVYLIGREISSDRTVRIHCHIEKEDIHLLPGMYLKAIVETGQQKVPALPDEAIIDYQGQKYIFIKAEEGKPANAAKADPENTPADHHFKMIAVDIGNSDAGYTEVILPEGIDKSNIVVKGAYSLLSKMKNSEEEEGH